MSTTVTIETVSSRCYMCGRWWWGEQGHVGTCPNCAEKEIIKLRDERATMWRRIYSLRGVISRLQRKAAK